MKIRILAAASVLLVATACGAATTDDAQVDTEQAEPLVSQTASGKTVRLLELGAEPRTVLQTTATLGDTRRIGLTLELQQQIDAGSFSQDVSIPTGLTVTSYSVAAIDGETFTLDSVIERQEIVDNAGADPAVIAQTEDLYQRFSGVTGTLVTDSQMDVLDSSIGDIDLPPELAPFLDTFFDSLESQASNLAQPFPPSAVGLGAVWEVVSRAEITGLEIETITRYTLTERTDTTARADVEQTLTFVAGPTTINGIDAEVLGGTSTGSGFILWDLTFPLPIGGDIATSGDVRIEAQGQEITTVQTQRFVTELLPG